MTRSTITTLCVCLLATAAGFASLAAPAAAADAAMEWQFYEESGQGNGTKTARLIYAVPETDNALVYGDCEAGKAGSPNFVFGADIGNLEKGKDVELRFSGGGFDHALKGKTHHPESEQDLSGVAVEIANDDPLWAAMDEKESLDYLVPGYKADTIDLTRGRDKIKQFAQTCRNYAAEPAGAQADAGGKDGGESAEKEAFESAKELGTVEAWEAFLANYSSGFRADLARAYIKKLGSGAPAEAASMPNVSASKEVPDPPCKNRKNLRSQVSDEATKITFINRSGGMRDILWLDFNGQPKHNAHLHDGEEAVFDTFVTHPWMITDGPGNCLQIVMPHPGARVVEIVSAGADKAVTPKPTAKKVTGCEEGYKLVKGKCKRITAREAPQGCPPGTKPVPETDNCVPIVAKSKSGCGKGQIKIDGQCVAKRDAATFCGPGYRLKGNSCVQGYAAPKPQLQLPTWQLEAISKGCRPGQGWNPQEGCHEND
jgi:hypothetical protein